MRHLLPLLIAAALLAGCGLFPSDPVQYPLALHKVGDGYAIRLGGDCDYPAETVVRVQASGAGTVFWQARLPAGSSENEIVLGSPGLSTQVPLRTPSGTLDISVSSPDIGWANTFVLDRVTADLNGGSLFGDGPVEQGALDADC